MKLLITMMLCFSSLSACEKCYECFDWLSKSERFRDHEDEDDLFWKGYMQAYKHAFFFCRDVVKANHPECEIPKKYENIYLER